MKEFIKIWWHGAVRVDWYSRSDYYAFRTLWCGRSKYVLRFAYLRLEVK
jgi:hypothetical protein